MEIRRYDWFPLEDFGCCWRNLRQQKEGQHIKILIVVYDPGEHFASNKRNPGVEISLL